MSIVRIVADLAAVKGRSRWPGKARKAWLAALARPSPVDTICGCVRAAMAVDPARLSPEAARAIDAAAEMVERYRWHGMADEAAAYRESLVERIGE